MKEFLVNHDNKWTLQLLDADTEENSFRVAVPSGATHYSSGRFKESKKVFIKLDGSDQYEFYNGEWLLRGSPLSCAYFNKLLLWQRSQQPEELPFVDDEPKGISEGLHGLAQAASELSKKMKNKSMGFGFMTLKNDEPTLNDTYAEIEQVRQTLNERQSTYGDFTSVANTTGQLMAVILNSKNGRTLPYAHKEALHMICSKIARIMNGDINHKDSWHDIQGYAKLIEDLL